MVVTAVVAAAATYTAVTVKNQADEQKRAQNRALEQQKIANECELTKFINKLAEKNGITNY